MNNKQEPWKHASHEERNVLARVEAQTLQQYDEQQEHTSKATSHVAWRPIVAMSFMGALALTLWFGWPPPSTIPGLSAEGMLKFARQQKLVKTTMQRSAKIHDPQGWTLRSQTKTQLQIARPAPRETEIKLKKGAIAVHVIPGSMKRFVVKCKNKLRVVVKGTKFLVRQSKSGVRVEVTRGHVMVKRDKRVLLHLYKGQGVRFTNDSNDLFQTYRIPPPTENWFTKVETFAKHHPEKLFSYALEVRTAKSLDRKLRLQIMEASAHALQGAKRWVQASHLWLRIYRMNTKGFGAQTALYQAAQSCRMSSQKRIECAALYQAFLKHFPNGLLPLRKASQHWLTTMRSHAK